MKKLTGLAIGLFSVLSWANPMCVELCTPCADKTEDATCAKVDSICGCTVILDSLAKAQEAAAAAKAEAEAAEAEALEAKNEAISNGKKQLTLDLLEGCSETTCEKLLHFTEGAYTHSEISESSAAPSVPVTDNAASPDKITLLEDAGSLAEIAANICEHASGECIAKISYESTTMKLLSIQKQETASELPQDAAADSAAVLQTEEQPTTQTEKIAQPEQPEQPQGNDQKAAPANPNQKNLYKGVALSYGYFIERDYLRLGIHGYDGENNYDGAITWLMRWYFYSAGSLQAGLGVSYHHAEYDSDKYKFLGNIDYYDYDWYYGSFDYDRSESVYLSIDGEEHTISLEIPLTLRLGIPFAKGFAPYASGTFMVRKPIYGWADVDVDDWWFTEDDTGMKSDFYSDEDWEFVGWLGFGVEFTRHFSVEYQMMLFSTSTGIGHEYYPEDSWRVNLQFAW